jgi:hypothetical protein
MIILLLQNLWSNIIRSPKPLLHLPPGIKHPRRPKINNFDWGVLVLGLIQNILGLEVSMHDVLAMAIVDSLEDLFDNFDGVVLAETVLFNHSIE